MTLNTIIVILMYLHTDTTLCNKQNAGDTFISELRRVSSEAVKEAAWKTRKERYKATKSIKWIFKEKNSYKQNRKNND